MHNQTNKAAFQSWEAVCYKTGEPKLEIVYEDPDLLVCKKAPGLPVQSARLGVSSVESLLKNQLAQQTGKVPYVGIVQRLDQPVQGLFVVAKNGKSAAALSAQVQNGQLKKHYRAVCHVTNQRMCEWDALQKDAPKTWQDWTDWLRKEGRTNVSEVVDVGTDGGKKAELSYCVEEYNAELQQVLVTIHLKTGRHHQIRVQFASHGMPLVGDHKYGQPDESTVLQLCSYELAFVHPRTKKEMYFTLES